MDTKKGPSCRQRQFKGNTQRYTENSLDEQTTI